MIASNTSSGTGYEHGVVTKVIGIGSTGCAVVDHLTQSDWPGARFIAMHTDPAALERLQGAEECHLGKEMPPGMGVSGDPELAEGISEEDAERIREICRGANLIVVVAALGGGVGTGAAPILVRLAKEVGAIALGIVTLPFDCEGPLRQKQARRGFSQLKTNADGVICFPNQTILAYLDKHSSLIEFFNAASDRLVEAVQRLGRILLCPGFMKISFSDLCAVLQGRQMESAFVHLEGTGERRLEDAVSQLVEHSLVKRTRLGSPETLLVHIEGGSDLTMAEVNALIEKINHQFGEAQVVIGTSLEEHFEGAVGLNVLLSRRNFISDTGEPKGVSGGDESNERAGEMSQDLKAHYENQTVERSTYRFVPPPPVLTEERREKILREARDVPWKWQVATKLRPGYTPFEILSNGRFEKSEPTIHRGEDLDVPTYIRRELRLD